MLHNIYSIIVRLYLHNIHAYTFNISSTLLKSNGFYFFVSNKYY